ncbi:MAG: tRNA lysidine(34) synthetase TilS [Phycisphaerales bacterium]|nr:MAG: tRNA lysidine(34) synthetase TilS [Phycisphaerales bacterium]
MAPEGNIRQPEKKQPGVRRIVSAWRRLHPDADRPTLLACSAGADSSALLLALRTATDRLIAAHIRHDLRPDSETEGDLDAARSLAESLGVPFRHETVRVRELGGNAEAEARRARYAALSRIASEEDCASIALAHHADDQLETVLMALLRGAGPGGLSGMPPSRIDPESGVRLIRPMLRVHRAEAEAICRACGWVWREDATNRDTDRLRAGLRHLVIPQLLELRPDAPLRACDAADLLRGCQELIEQGAAELGANTDRDGAAARLDREDARQSSPVVLGQWIRDELRRISGGVGMDRVRAREVAKVCRAIADGSGEARVFTLGPGVVRVERDSVVVEPARPQIKEQG